ncbi:MAG TPA: hypothetical protein VIP98_08855 [Microlunatus sp.]
MMRSVFPALLAGVPGEDIGDAEDAGRVQVVGAPAAGARCRRRTGNGGAG